MISDAEIEWLDSEMKYKLGFRDTVKIAEACLALIARLRAAEKERNAIIEQCAKVCRETRGTKTFFSFYDTGERELGCEQCEEAILALKETP